MSAMKTAQTPMARNSAETKADLITKAAWASIEAERKARDAKTRRLKAARLEQQAQLPQPEAKTVARRKAAAPRAAKPTKTKR